MRLNERQRLGLLDALQETFPHVQGTLKLYGSRTQDELKGGDIDLCLIVNTNQEAENLQTKIIPFLMAVTKRIGDQKIDFAVISKQQSQTDPFWKLALVRSLDF